MSRAQTETETFVNAALAVVSLKYMNFQVRAKLASHWKHAAS
jgi:hypothetical protein